MLDSPECGETTHLSDTSPPNDAPPTLQLAHPRDVILCRADGCPKKGPNGRPTHMKGKTEEESMGTSFLHRHNDGTHKCGTIIKPRVKRLEGNKDCNCFVIKCNKSQVEDAMACNDITNCLHWDQLADDGTSWKF